MLNFAALLTNEWIKLYKKKTFYVYFIMMAIFIGIGAYVAHLGYLEEIVSMRGFVEAFVSMDSAGQLLPTIAIIAIASVVTIEFRLGTIKLLLIRAQSRNKILASKYIVSLLYALTLIVATFAMAVLAGALLYGFKADAGSWTVILENMLYLTLYTFVFVTLTFMVGVLTKSSGGTVGIALFCIMIEGLFKLLLLRYDFIKYILFPNADLTVYLNGGTMPHGMSMAFSSSVIAGYMVLFLVISFVTFRIRDVS